MDDPDTGDAMVIIAIVVSRIEALVLRFLALWLALNAAAVGLGVAAGLYSAWVLVGVPFAALSVPVNPQGRGEFYLAPDAA